MRTPTLFAALLLTAPGAALGASADKIFMDMETALGLSQTQVLEYAVISKLAGAKTETPLSETVKIDAGQRMRQEFTAPKDLKGTRILVLSSTQIYVYLPAFGKVRRIASATGTRDFMGTLFGPLEYGLSRLSDYDASAYDETARKLTLTAKSPGNYSKLEVIVDPAKYFVPTRIDYFTDAGLLKTETLEKYTCKEQVCSPALRTMTAKDGGWTTLERKSWKTGVKFSDDEFSKRTLEK
ncbi:MAG: outer membrane lipoprotein-sorting protein [Elusimicrobia bacterium]|nr:outer membrane lipoprotein-sorting protein [Elusimicrobiota bacterium]